MPKDPPGTASNAGGSSVAEATGGEILAQTAGETKQPRETTKGRRRKGTEAQGVGGGVDENPCARRS
eukprot:CAMPEP_0172087930 /NCGR_PEP_ID=MMETSP1043-20130122/22957_1 /TAXON_ID=464988 /ORGANISM="Hemiselmis andersenii, Strain CCMP441" /LENGTH=66 /DNA_ID=CAMNT_0012750189 /DNA_START=3 /DNA_END=200 /DNA_ORIENTATION=+